jgi:hypothetical protein
MSVEQSWGPLGPGSVGFGGSEVADVAEAAAGVLASAEVAVADPDPAADEEVVLLAAAFFVPEDFEPPHPAASVIAASAAAVAAASRRCFGRLESVVSIRRSMPCERASARGNPTMFIP